MYTTPPGSPSLGLDYTRM